MPSRSRIAQGGSFVVWRGVSLGENAEWESGMKIDPAEGHPAMDYAEHVRTYHMFLKLSAYTVVIAAIVLAGLTMFVV